MKQYNTNPSFKKEVFSEMLNRIGVKSEVNENGLTFDDKALKEIKVYEMPQWLIQNLRFMV